MEGSTRDEKAKNGTGAPAQVIGAEVEGAPLFGNESDAAVAGAGGGPGSDFPIFWTLALNVAMVGIGIALAMLGPTLLQLAERLQVSLAKAGTLFTFRALGYLLGALTSGQLLERCRPAPVMLVPLLFACGGCFLIPTLRDHTVACFLFSFQGMSMGMLDVGGNVLVMSLWRGSRFLNGLMHAMHFCFGLGAFLAPLFVGIWLDLGGAAVQTWTLVSAGIAPACVCLAALSFLPQPGITPEEEGGSALNPIVIGSGAFLFVYVGLEVTFGGFIDAFAVTWLGAEEADAAWLTSVYWGSLCVGRLVAAIATPYVNHTLYIIAHLLAAIAAMAWMTIATRSPMTAYYPGWFLSATLPSAVVGFAFAPLFPGAMLIAEELLGRAVSGPAASIMVTSAASGEMILPLLAGSLMSLEPMMFCWVQLVLCGVAAVVLLGVLKGGSGSVGCCSLQQSLLPKDEPAPSSSL